MNQIDSESIPHIHEAPKLAVKCKENINYFISALEEHGVARHRLFQVSDIYDNINFYRVLECLEDLAALVEQQYPGEFPTLEPPVTDFDESIYTDAQIQEAERDLRFTNVKSRPVQHSKTVSPRKRNSSNLRKSMAIHNPQVLKEEMEKLKIQTADTKAQTFSAVAQLQAYVRGRIARRIHQKRVTNQAYRKRIAQELLSTEKVYVDNLDVLVTVFLHPLKTAASGPKHIIKQEAIKAIFSDSIEVILNYNRRLLAKLEEKISDWSPWQRIGDMFIEFTSFLKVYTQYVKDFPQAQDAFDSLKAKNTRFSKFLQDCKTNPGTTGLELDAYLILPIQRIPRYNLLLGEMVKHTWADHHDYASLKKALEKMQEVALYINERKREADSINKIVEIQSKFHGKIENLQDPHRRFVREGVLMVLRDPPKGPKDRIFILFNDKLLLVKTGKTLFKREEEYILLETHEVRVIAAQVDLQNPTTFVMRRGDPTLVLEQRPILYRLVASSAEERDNWIKDVNQAAEESDKKFQRNHSK
eukprot:TRINITY_DN2118_c0_g1_i3.p1 TRINITY_DN2118_c0_g1~~TRINITY_DN2118_c0_g1_i3.p1  ORF type:complete len:592 (+),score=142.31 TRINITY_DN2118_c0_g1_i3:191-1777(+)